MNTHLTTIAVTTDGSGDFTTDFVVPSGGGRFLQYRYVPDGSSPLDTGADLDVTGKTTGFVYVNHDNLGVSAIDRIVRGATYDIDGSALLYAASGEPVEEAAAIGGEPLTVTISNGGASKAGTLYIWTG